MLRKDPSSHSVAQVWLALLSQTRQESRDHNGLSESCSNFLIQPLTHCLEYTQRLAKKVLIQALALAPTKHKRSLSLGIQDKLVPVWCNSSD